MIGAYETENTLKLNLLFIVIDLLTLLAYPVVFLAGKLRQFSKLVGGKALVVSTAIIPDPLSK